MLIDILWRLWAMERKKGASRVDDVVPTGPISNEDTSCEADGIVLPVSERLILGTLSPCAIAGLPIVGLSAWPALR